LVPILLLPAKSRAWFVIQLVCKYVTIKHEFPTENLSNKKPVALANTCERQNIF
jgi:hypothetical protein